MKIKVNKREIGKIIDFVKTIENTNFKNSDCAKISAFEKIIVVQAANQETSITLRLEGEILQLGSVVVSIKRLEEHMKILKKETEVIIIEKNDSLLELQADSIAKIAITPGDIGEIVIGKTGTVFTMIGQDISNALNFILPAINVVSSNGLFEKCCIQFSSEQIKWIATDGNKLMINTPALDSIVSDIGSKKLLISYNQVLTISKIFSKDNSTVNINYFIQNGKEYLAFVNKSINLTLLTSNSDYFKYEEILQQDFKDVIMINAKDFKKDILSLPENPGKKALILDFECKNGELKMIAKSDCFFISNSRPYEIISLNNDFKFSCSVKYMKETIKYIEDEKLELSFCKSGLIKIKGELNSDFIAVVGLVKQ